MAKGKRNRTKRRKTVAALEAGLTALRELRQRYEDMIKKLNTKIAAQEGLIEVAKEDEAAEAAAAEAVA
jgi:hypothetical protein